MCADRPFRIETRRLAIARRSLLIGRLNRRASSESLALVKRLKSCNSSSPCHSGACPVCVRTFRKALLSEGRNVLRTKQVFRVSWVPPGGVVANGELSSFDLSRFAAKLLRALQRSLPSNAAAIGGIDISLNVNENRDAAWQFHGYALVALPAIGGRTSSDLRKALRQSLPLCDVAARPLHVGEVLSGDVQRVLSYASKSDFYRRSSYAYTRRETGRSSRNTRAQALPADAAVELALLLDRFPLGARLLLVGVRRYGQATRPTLRATQVLSSRVGVGNRRNHRSISWRAT